MWRWSMIERAIAVPPPTGAALTPLVSLPSSGGFLGYAVVFALLAVVAAVFGLRGVAGLSMEIARIFVLLFIVLAVIALFL